MSVCFDFFVLFFFLDITNHQDLVKQHHKDKIYIMLVIHIMLYHEDNKDKDKIKKTIRKSNIFVIIIIEKLTECRSFDVTNMNVVHLRDIISTVDCKINYF